MSIATTTLLCPWKWAGRGVVSRKCKVPRAASGKAGPVMALLARGMDRRINGQSTPLAVNATALFLQYRHGQTLHPPVPEPSPSTCPLSPQPAPEQQPPRSAWP